MKHLATIQVEFLKEAREWDEMSYDEQKEYLKKHRKSKRKLTAKPEAAKKIQQQLEQKRLEFMHNLSTGQLDKIQREQQSGNIIETTKGKSITDLSSKQQTNLKNNLLALHAADLAELEDKDIDRLLNEDSLKYVLGHGNLPAQDFMVDMLSDYNIEADNPKDRSKWVDMIKDVRDKAKQIIAKQKAPIKAAKNSMKKSDFKIWKKEYYWQEDKKNVDNGFDAYKKMTSKQLPKVLKQRLEKSFSDDFGKGYADSALQRALNEVGYDDEIKNYNKLLEKVKRDPNILSKDLPNIVAQHLSTNNLQKKKIIKPYYMKQDTKPFEHPELLS